MKTANQSIYIIIFLLVYLSSYSQTINTPESSLHAPIKVPMLLSGNFGELRSGHFHSGIDIKTQGIGGHKLYSVADGYVSRIKISSSGYGKALYIHHPNIGLTSVYAHLQSFSKEIKNYVIEEQYKNKTYEIQLFPEKNDFKVKAGELIALSGNSGSSKGPHLHFELRKLDNQHPINPLNFNFDIRDNISPKIFQIALYPANRSSSINGSHEKVIIDTRQVNDNNYTLDIQEPLILHGGIGFGIKTYDFLNRSRNWCGVHTIELKIDSTSIYQHKIDEFAFQNTRFINSFIDYEEKIKNNSTIQKLFLQPNNNLNIYQSVNNRGIFKFTQDTVYTVQYEVKDVYGNSSSLSFKVRGNSEPGEPDSSINNNFTSIFPYEKENKYYEDNIKIDFPSNAFYDTVYFNYKRIETDNKAFYSDIHMVHDQYTPVHKYFTLSLKTKNLPSSLKEKIFIAKMEEEKKYNFQGGEIINGFIITKVREFGKYVIMADTVNPTIQPVTDLDQVNKSGQITFRIEDDLSGIDSYNGFIDGEWVLFEYDEKNNLLHHNLKNGPVRSHGTHELELYVGDKKNNIATFYKEFKINK